jgi:hypothetical protein
MPRLAPVFERFMAHTSAGGPSVTREELAEAVRTASAGELETFAKQALDSIADGEIVRLLTDKIGRDRIPPPTNTLRDDPAARSWLDGQIELRKTDTDATKKQAIRVMQRALVKIGVHHPEGSRIAELLQLPWAADGALGDTTLKALNRAMELAGRNDLAHLDASTVLGRDVAATLESLLSRTIRLVFPGSINPPPSPNVRNVVVFIGMGDHSSHEADHVKRALPAGCEMAYVGDSSLGDDMIKVAVGATQVVFDLKTDQGRQNFVNTAFRPPLALDQKIKVREALEAQSWGIADARDEIAMTALEFHRADVSEGRRKIPYLYVSGHSAGGGVWGDHNGELPMEALRKIAEAFPTAASTVEYPFFAACNHLHPANVEELMGIFSGMKRACGYSAYAPGTWVGGIAQCLAWMHCLSSGREPITPEMMMEKLRELKRSAAGNDRNPLHYAMEKAYHVATWNASDTLYRWHEDQGGGRWITRTKEMRPDPAEIAARLRVVRQLEPEFARMLRGESTSAELRDMVPHGDNLACKFYEGAVKLAGTMGLSRDDATWAAKQKALGLRARYYERILTKFGENFSQLIGDANRELAAVGFSAKSVADLASSGLKRKAMLQYIAALGVQVQAMVRDGKPRVNTEKLFVELDTRVGKLDNIPSSWL